MPAPLHLSHGPELREWWIRPTLELSDEWPEVLFRLEVIFDSPDWVCTRMNLRVREALRSCFKNNGVPGKDIIQASQTGLNAFCHSPKKRVEEEVHSPNAFYGNCHSTWVNSPWRFRSRINSSIKGFDSATDSASCSSSERSRYRRAFFSKNDPPNGV